MPTPILGGALVAHAPQFFTLPPTEDKATVARVERLMGEIGDALDALNPDVWIMIANDHANQFFLHCAPPFTLHLGATAKGHFAGREFAYPIPSETSHALVRALYDEGFDPAFSSAAEIDYAFGIPLTFMRVRRPVIPLYVNAYLPPQPSMERCYAFGRALERALTRLGVTAVVTASGGMSHFPGTERYSRTELEWDQAFLERIKAGNLRATLSLSEQTLDETGNIELRCWAVAAGALGERVPDVAAFDPSWHHNYATIGFTRPVLAQPPTRPHYPPTDPKLVPLVDLLHRLANDAATRARFRTDVRALAREAGIDGAAAEALVRGDWPAFARLGVHPLVPFLAKLQLDREAVR